MKFESYKNKTKKPTEHVLGSELSQVSELQVDVNDGYASCNGQNDDVIAIHFLEKSIKADASYLSFTKRVN